MIRLLKRTAKLVIVMVPMTLLLSMIWTGFVTDTLYNCTDAVGFDYFHPGDWVHARVAFVSHIVAGRSMSDPDTIKEGWSKAGLWSLWILFFVVSLMVSILLARKEWVPARSAERGAPPNGGTAKLFGNSPVAEGPPSVK